MAIHTVAVLVLDGFVPLDVGIPSDIFGTFGRYGLDPLYRVKDCAPKRTVRSDAFSLRAPFGLDAVRGADTVVVPGIVGIDAAIPEPVIDALRAAWRRGARIASICSGAFVLAAAGLLDGRRATTHWLGSTALARRYPSITVVPEVLFVDEGRIVTSAGVSSGLDMCLHLVRRDYGQAVAAQVARLAVAPLNRDGGQSQFIRQESPVSTESLAPVLEWMGANLGKEMDVASISRRAHMSPRTFARRFREQTGTTPLQWLVNARVRRAQELLETTRRSIDDVAARAGFESSVTFRARFRKVVGLNPRAYRQRFAAPDSRRTR